LIRRDPDGAPASPPIGLLILDFPEIVHASATGNFQAVCFGKASKKSSDRVLLVRELHVSSGEADGVVEARLHQQRDFIAISSSAKTQIPSSWNSYRSAGLAAKSLDCGGFNCQVLW